MNREEDKDNYAQLTLTEDQLLEEFAKEFSSFLKQSAYSLYNKTMDINENSTYFY